MKAVGHSTWTGTWKEGSGTISTEDGTVRSAPYTYASRFEGAEGASPEELLAAAHAGCYNQALANNLGKNGLAADEIVTAVEITMGRDDNGSPVIADAAVSVRAKVPRASREIFDACAERARTNCSIAKAVKYEIRMQAVLEA